MILLIDNYDSFVYNLARYFRELRCDTTVVRNDEITVPEVVQLNPQAVVLSPGPGEPQDAGISVELTRAVYRSIPLFGVCLGHQAIAVALGGTVRRAAVPVHGQTSMIRHDESRLFDTLPNPLRATRYHSLVVDEAGLPESLHVTARTSEGTVMALRHRRYPVFGVQFHPESVLTENGHTLLANFLRLIGVQESIPCAGEVAVPTDNADDIALPQPLHW